MKSRRLRGNTRNTAICRLKVEFASRILTTRTQEHSEHLSFRWRHLMAFVMQI